MTTVLAVDNSMLMDVSRCTRKAVLKNHHDLQGMDESKYLLAGSAVHAALDEYFKSDGDTKRAMSELALQYSEFGSDATKVEQDDRLSWRNVRSVMQGWFDDHTLDVLPFVVTASEQPFVVKLTDDIIVVGRVDGRCYDKNAGPSRQSILEHKTTGKIDKTWIRQFHVSSQCSEYLWAAELLDGHELAGIYVNGIELSKAPSDPSRKCKTHGTSYAECGSKHQNHNIVPVGRSETDIDGWKQDAKLLAIRYWEAVTQWPALEQVADIPAEGKFNGECSWCSFYSYCAVGCPTGAVGTNIRVGEAWEPAPGVSPGKWYASDMLNTSKS